jgi:hypothetical protein
MMENELISFYQLNENHAFISAVELAKNFERKYTSSYNGTIYYKW